MPQTTYRQGPNERPKDESERELRDIADRHHLQCQYRLFAAPFEICPRATPPRSSPASTNDVDRMVRWEAIQNNTPLVKTLAQMTPEDCRYFCFKDCALYIVSATQSYPDWRMRVFETIYRRWFANRAEDLDVSPASFFCRPVRFHSARGSGAPVSLDEIAKCHDTLCGKLKKATEEMTEQVPRPQLQPIERALHLPPANYRVRETFERCFVVMRGEWDDHDLDREVTKERGVLVVFRSVEDAEKHGRPKGNEMADGVTDVTGEYEDLNEAWVIRCDSLELAMKVGLASDPKRDVNEPEWHGGYEEVLDPEDTTPLWLCNCNICGHDRKTEGPVHEPRFFS